MAGIFDIPIPSHLDLAPALALGVQDSALGNTDREMVTGFLGAVLGLRDAWRVYVVSERAEIDSKAIWGGLGDPQVMRGVLG